MQVEGLPYFKTQPSGLKRGVESPNALRAWIAAVIANLLGTKRHRPFSRGGPGFPSSHGAVS